MGKNIFEKLGIDIKNGTGLERGFFRSLNKIYQENVARFENPENEEFMHNFIAAFMLDYKKANGNFDIKVPYRIKSSKSLLDKILEYMIRDDKSVSKVNSLGEYEANLKEEITDMLAITIVGGNRPPTFYSEDPEIQELIDEKSRNHTLLKDLQKFSCQITDPKTAIFGKKAYKYNCSRREYYMKSKILIERIETLLDPNATELKKYYDSFLNFIDNELENTSTEYLDGFIDKDCIKKVNYNSFLSDFTGRIHDKLDLAVLTKQVIEVFENSALLKKFNVQIDKDSFKKKRTPSGYVSNFVYLNTPLGKVEVQIQPQHEYEEGNYGHSAHSNMKGKKIEPFFLPIKYTLKELEEFKTKVKMISPRKFLAQYDSGEPNRVITQIFGEYQNYKSLMSQVKKNSASDLQMKAYFSDLYSRRKEIFDNEETVESFIVYDLQEYLKTDRCKNIISNSKFRKKVADQDAR